MWLISWWVVGNLRDWLVLLDDAFRIVGARERLDEFWECGQGGKGGIAVGKRGEGCMLQSDGEYGGREGSNCCMGRLLLNIGPPPSCHLSHSEQLDTVYKLFSGLIFI